MVGASGGQLLKKLGKAFCENTGARAFSWGRVYDEWRNNDV